MKRDSKEKIAALFEELPWLKTWFEQQEIDAIKVQRVDEELLNVTAYYHGGDTMFGIPSSIIPAIYLFDSEGQRIGRVGCKYRPYGNPNAPRWQFWRRAATLGFGFTERVGDSLSRLAPEANKIAFIVKLENVDDDDNYDKYVSVLTVYKKPQGLSMTQFVQKVVVDHQSALHAVLAEIK